MIKYIYVYGVIYMNRDKINELEEKLDIVEVIDSYLDTPLIKKSNKYYMGKCPFHGDKNPSMYVDPVKKTFRCFACQASGNIFSFVMKKEDITFPEAVKKLADSIGMDMGIKVSQKEIINKQYFEMMDLANKYYQNNLQGKEGVIARNYLENRKLTKETIKEFEIGLSLSKYDDLTNLLIKKGHSLEELNKIDLSNTNHDTFINRIIFPLHNKDGKVVGFSGRKYTETDLKDENVNKYQNSKETPIFKKGELLFNYHRAKDAIRLEKFVIVMEGFMAVIRAHTIGVNNCIATMGTALTPYQANLIKKLSNKVYLCYDGDNAGQKQALESGNIFTNMGCDVYIVPLSDKLDPDDYVIKYGKEAFKNLVDNPIPFSEFKINSIKKNYNLNNDKEKRDYINQVLSNIVKEKDKLTAEIMLQNLANDTNSIANNIDSWYNDLHEEFLALKEKEKRVIEKEDFVVKKDKKSGYLKAMESLVYYSLNYPRAITLIDNSSVYIPNKEIRLILNEIIAYYNKYGEISESDFYTYLMQNELTDLYNVVMGILSNDYPNEYNDDLVNDNLLAIKKYNIALEVKKLEKEIKEEVDIAKQMELMDKMLSLKTKEGKTW